MASDLGVFPPGFVAQDTQLFTCSIEENLAYGLGREHSKDRGTWMERRRLSKKVGGTVKIVPQTPLIYHHLS